MKYASHMFPFKVKHRKFFSPPSDSKSYLHCSNGINWDQKYLKYVQWSINLTSKIIGSPIESKYLQTKNKKGFKHFKRKKLQKNVLKYSKRSKLKKIKLIRNDCIELN